MYSNDGCFHWKKKTKTVLWHRTEFSKFFSLKDQIVYIFSLWALSFSLEDCISLAGAEPPKMSCKTRSEQVEQTGWGQSRAEQSCVAREGPSPRATIQPCCSKNVRFHNRTVSLLSCSTAMLHHSHAISQLSCLHQIKFPSLPHPKLGSPVGVELVPRTIGWHPKRKSCTH